MAPSRENDDDRNNAAIPSLPFEIIEEILSKLPVKFLMQLQSVCKSWKSLISDPKFAKKHLRLSTTRHHILQTYTKRLSEFVVVDYPFSSFVTELTAAAAIQLDFPLPNGTRFHYIVGSCHGIICFELDKHFSLLWNPSIRKFMTLPSLAIPKQEIIYTAYGFGYVYDQFNDNYSYKVVAVNHIKYIKSDNDDIYYHYKYRPQVKVYTLGTNSWRMIEDPPSGIPLAFESGRFVSGTVNWFNFNYVIVSLDLDNETYQEIMQPDYGLEIQPRVTLVVLRDCLSIIAESYTYLDVWLMNEYGNTESWTKLFRIPRSESPYYIKPLYLSEDDQVLLLMESHYVHQSKIQSELAIYNYRDSTLEKTTEIQKLNGGRFYEVYQESLITPCS